MYQFSAFGPYRGCTGYDTLMRSFLREWYAQGHQMATVEFEKWSNMRGPTEIDPILQETDAHAKNGDIDCQFHINFSLLDQTRLNPNIMNVCYTMFESSKICPQWVEGAKRLDLIVVPTEFNRKTFAESGIPANKLAVCPCPLDIEKITTPVPIVGLKAFGGEDIMKYKHRFLNCSEFINRKNVEQLIQVWCDETKETDDACLILKLNSNSGVKLDFFKQKVEQCVKNKKCAPIFLFTKFINDNLMLALYQNCTHYISMSFGEGWGLSESTCGVLGKRVLAPRSTAFLDYLNEENSYPIQVNTIRANQDGPTAGYYFNSNWYNPIIYSARRNIRLSIKEANEGESKKGPLLAKQLKEKCDSFKVAAKLLSIIDKHNPKKSNNPLGASDYKKHDYNFMLVCKSYDTKCGIADYSKNLWNAANVEANKRLYKGNIVIKGEAVDYTRVMEENDIHVMNIQLEYQFISPRRLRLLLDYCVNTGIKPCVTLHTVNPRAYDYHEAMLETNCNVVVSSKTMADVLTSRCGFDPKNVKVIPMGINKVGVTTAKKRDDNFIRIGFFGFTYFHKGIDKLVQYMGEYGANKQCIVFSTKPENDRGYFDKVKGMFDKANKGNMQWVTEYLDENVIIEGLSTCDVIFLPYSEYGGVGVSAAVRTCLKAGVPILAFENSFFKDVVKDSNLIEWVGNDPDDFNDWSDHLNQYLDVLAKSKDQVKGVYEQNRDKFLEVYSWENMASRYLEHFNDLITPPKSNLLVDEIKKVEIL